MGSFRISGEWECVHTGEHVHMGSMYTQEHVHTGGMYTWERVHTGGMYTRERVQRSMYKWERVHTEAEERKGRDIQELWELLLGQKAVCGNFREDILSSSRNRT